MSDDETTLQQALFTTGHEESGSSDFDEYIQDEGAETASSGSSFDELDDSEFPRYFSERRGRLYHSSTTAPYPLPVDTPEQQRHTVSHNILKRLMGGNYLGPVPAALAAGQDRKVLDLCTGNGKWVTEMAEEFPHVSFTGIDIVPIATRYPPR
ncbi:hypothetical protein CC2G_001978 [Coprinopsis cinerea AmutBmut pab1-1]|nr:hypothetical protein CC2G_001978 [Coprinopsis cinerea AmutBmut pab1-1]